MIRINIIAALTSPPSQDGAGVGALPAEVEWLEVCADLAGDIDPDWLRDRFAGRLLYSLRSRAEGGNDDRPLDLRHERLRRAARSFDLVELEGERDLTTDLLAQIPAEKRLISWHGAAANLHDLEDRFEQLSSVPARFYKLKTNAAKCGDELLPLALLGRIGRPDVVAYADGPLGFWTRLIAPSLGAPLVYGLVADGAAIPAGPTVDRLIEDYGFPRAEPVEGIYGIVGSQVFKSLSPRLHNAAYRGLKHPALFVPFRAESFKEFWDEVAESEVLKSLGMPVKGLTVTSPHKEAALLTTRKVSPMSRRAESVNILVRDNGSWRADTTDPEVVFMASRERRVRVEQRRAAVIGCGGAGRAIATALAQSGAGVTLVNRGPERGHYASRLLDLPYAPLQGFSARGYDIVVNATPVGRDDGASPFRVETLERDSVVIDLVYGCEPTPLVAGALALDRTAVDGREVLLTQVLRQFQMMTGRDMPVHLMREKLGIEEEMMS
ncbi:MAG TPA: type I 3-dehydroquinate dehydratase [Pyrinomonadaceae bacterium]|nr:type I 3-dehydroquinate dehydratase [Pyrinomonadaceae bacterium]